jgi:hypothetical protein
MVDCSLRPPAPPARGPRGDVGASVCGPVPGATVPGAKAPEGMTLFVDTVWPGPGSGRIFCAGAPCLDREKAFILAAISEVSPLARVGGGPGRRAALIWPRGAEDRLMGFEYELSLAARNEGGLEGFVESEIGCDGEGELGALSDRL